MLEFGLILPDCNTSTFICVGDNKTQWKYLEYCTRNLAINVASNITKLELYNVSILDYEIKMLKCLNCDGANWNKSDSYTSSRLKDKRKFCVKLLVA